MPSPRVLLVEDEEDLRLAVGDRLRSEGLEVSVEDRGDTALNRLREEDFDLVVLDIMLPGVDGLGVCRIARAEGIHVPILMLTARGGVTDRVIGLRLGADDYLSKPFDMSELLARVDALLRRSGPVDPKPAAPAEYWFGDVHVDTRRAEVTRADQLVTLSAKEYRLLTFFLEHPGEAVSRDKILDEVWGYRAAPQTRTVDVHVASLRRKLGDSSHQTLYIQTLRGIGYKFVGQDSVV